MAVVEGEDQEEEEVGVRQCINLRTIGYWVKQITLPYSSFLHFGQPY